MLFFQNWPIKSNQRLTDVSFYLVIILIIALSFFQHSSLFSPILNSDDAVVVLMIHNFHLPQDLYYWGANRFGSLIPLIGQIFYRILHFSPLASESIVHYLLLIAGFIGFASLFKSRLTKIIFAIFWFLPPFRMIDVLKFSQGEQYCLIGIAILLLNKIYIRPIEKYGIKQFLALSLVTIFFILSVWVSDLAIATVLIVLFIFISFFIKNNFGDFREKIFKKPELYFIISGFLIGALFIYYAKCHAVTTDNYYSFFDLKTISDSFLLFKKSIGDILLFKANEPFTSIYLYFVLVILGYVILNCRKIKYDKNNLKWFLIFSIDLIAIFIIILSSKWALLNGIPRRYFVCNYISFWIAFLITIESFNALKYYKILMCTILITVFTGGLGTIYNLKYIWPKTLTPMVKVVGEIKKLGNIGIIGDYWNSYIVSCPNPDLIKATPHDPYTVRNQDLVNEAFKQDKIYLIKDMWMESFPDTITLFNHQLQRKGSQFLLGNCYMNEYTDINRN
jgi:hypothetical protein